MASLTLRPPAFLLERLDSAQAGMLRPDGRGFDFTSPLGEPALAAPDSVSWRVFKNPVALFVGGVAAVVLELAEPRVRAGVWDHSSFRADPRRRMQRTGLAALVSVYGARSRAEAMIAGVVRAHEQVRGVTREGLVYAANDQDLLDWVFATATFGFGEAYHHWVEPLSGPDFDRLYAEGLPAARLYGAHGAPASRAEQEAMFATMAPSLKGSPELDDFLAIMRRSPLLPAALRPLQPLLVRAAVALAPPWARARLGLGGRWSLRPWEAALVRQAGVAADRMRLPSNPAVQACRRLRLPEDYLYRDQPAGLRWSLDKPLRPR